MSKITVTGQLTLTGGQLSAKETPIPPLPGGKELWAWGLNTSGHLGDGTILNRSSPVQVGALTDWTNLGVGFGGSNTHVIKTDGSLWGMGITIVVGDGAAISKSSPVQVGALTDWTTFDGGSVHVHAIKTDGSLWTWGSAGSKGRLGLGNATSYSSPVQVGALTDWASVSVATDVSSAVKTDGTLWTWGLAAAGFLGNGTASGDKSSPIQVGSLTDWAGVSAGTNHALAVKTDGSLWSWGRGSTGRLGHGDTVYQSSPVQIGSLTDWSSVSVGNDHSMALKTDGTLWGWGSNTIAAKAPVGDDTVIDRSSPVQIGALTDWASISSGRRHNVALKTDGTIWAWGEGSTGQLGDGPIFTYRKSPRQIGSETSWTNIKAGLNHSIALKDPS